MIRYVIQGLLCAAFIYLAIRFVFRPLLREKLLSLPLFDKDPSCMRCHSRLMVRVKRTALQRLISFLSGRRIRRYACSECKWSGLFRTY